MIRKIVEKILDFNDYSFEHDEEHAQVFDDINSANLEYLMHKTAEKLVKCAFWHKAGTLYKVEDFDIDFLEEPKVSFSPSSIDRLFLIS